MQTLTIMWIILQLLIGYQLVFPLLLSGAYHIAVLFQQKKARRYTSPAADYAIIVTAYEQTDQLHAVVNSLLSLNYSHYLIYVVADKCDISSLEFGTDKVVLLRPETILASNTASHFYAIRHFRRAHGRLTIIDSDNIVHPDYLLELNKWFDAGYLAVQGVRAAKNLNTMLACLDAARDKYYHYYDGKVLFGTGSSATLAGSGMAFTTSLYKTCLSGKTIAGPGFDKVLQYEIVRRGYRIAFAEQAIVYDEKTAHSDQLVNQRARWIQSWFRYFRYGFTLAGLGLVRFNLNQLLFGLVLLRPPLFMFLLVSCMLLLINLFIAPMAACIWALGLFLFAAGFVAALASQETDKRIYRSLLNIPRFMCLQVLSLTRARKAGKYSVATAHNTTDLP